MKKIITLLLFSIFLFSCGKEEIKSSSRDCNAVEYDKSFELVLGDEVCFPDGNVVILTNIEHHLCPCEIDCEWEKGLLVSLTTITENSTTEKQFFTSFVWDNRSIFNNYEIAKFSFNYGIDDSGVPCNKEDFDPNKTVLAFTISKI